ncbi:Forkhead box protein M1 [Varanus komodoensis]|nr:Forkhead box protein M1 [Varanus komodoensis]
MLQGCQTIASPISSSGELSQGKRSHVGQKKRYKDTLKASLKSLDIDTTSWETLAQDQSTWCMLIHQGCQTSEARRITIAQKKQALRKARVANAATVVPTRLPDMWQNIPCPYWPYQSPADTLWTAHNSLDVKDNLIQNIVDTTMGSREKPGVLASSEEPSAASIKEETSCDEELSPFATHQSVQQKACQISRESFSATMCIKEESDNFDSSEQSSLFLPAWPVKEEPAQPGEVLNMSLPAQPVTQKRQFTALKSPPQGMLDMLVIKRQERHGMGQSRRKQHLALPCSEEPVLLLPSSTDSESFMQRHDLPFEQEPPPLENIPYFSCFQGEGGNLKTPIKEMFCKLPVSSIPSIKAPVTSLSATEPWRLAPCVKETSNLDFSPVRTPPLPLLSLQGNLDFLEFSSTPVSMIPFCDSPQLQLLNAEGNEMVTGPLTSSPEPSKQASLEFQTSVHTENHSLLEGLVLDTMNDSLSKILLDASFPGLEDNLGTDFSWSQLIPELK